MTVERILTQLKIEFDTNQILVENAREFYFYKIDKCMWVLQENRMYWRWIWMKYINCMWGEDILQFY